MSVRSLYTGAIAAPLLLALACEHGRAPSSSSTPAPVPVPSPSATPVFGVGCPYGKGSLETTCSRGVGTVLLPQVEAAVDLVAQQPTGILDLSDQDPPGSDQYRIIDPKRFIEAVVNNLRAQGLCAEADYDYPFDRVNVKSSNDFSEQFNFGMSSGHVRRGGPAFRASCSPASFPVDPDPNWPPSGIGCAKPYPPPIDHFNSKIWQPGRDFVTFDSTPIVGPDAEYCRLAGYTDGRVYCPVRNEGYPDRVACEAWRVGKATDTGRDGPTWTLDGELCKGIAVNGCENHPDNQYKLFAAKNGLYKMCGQNGACGELKLGR
jgi:hypothetical protein